MARSSLRPDGSATAAPRVVEPMLAVTGRGPLDDDVWAFEAKWDGVRTIAHLDQGRLRLQSRNGNDMTIAYPEIGPLAETAGVSGAVLDGEIIATEAGRPSFSALQPRMHQRDPALIARLAHEVPVSYVIFDLLYLDGRSLLGQSYEDRRQFLVGLGLEGPAWTIPPSWTDTTLDQMMAATRAQGLEGVVAKRRDSIYRPGSRSDSWRKFKHQLAQEFVVGGWTEGQGARRGELGALLVGVYRDGALLFAGKVGTGFDRAMRARLVALLAPVARPDPPFTGEVPRDDGIHWVDPEMVVQVGFTEWTTTGHLRHPAFQGIRNDKAPHDVHRE